MTVAEALYLILLNVAFGADPVASTRVDHRDGTWSYPPSGAWRIGEREQIGAITWEYVGQARYGIDSSVGRSGFWVETEAHEEKLDPFSRILGSRRYRNHGEEWVAVDVDLGLLEKTLAAAGALSDDPDSDIHASMYPADEWVEDESYWFEPHSWTHPTCNGITYDVFDGEDWSVQGSLDTWEGAMVWIMAEVGDGLTAYCGGVFIDDDEDWILTAAHCLHDDADDPIPDENITVCSRGNWYSTGDCDNDVIEVVIGPDYNPWFWNPGDDYALVRASISTSYTRMQLSTASDSWVTDYTMRTHAFPNHKSIEPSCDINDDFIGIDTAGLVADAAWGLGAREMVSSFGPISAPTGTATYRMTIDGGPGFSGSPVWYCGDSSCNTGETGFVVAVWSGWNGFYTTPVGPKARNMNTWAQSVIDP